MRINREQTNFTLACIVLAGFAITVICVLCGFARADSVMAGTLMGYLSAKAEQVLAYYFGSTAGSQRKTELLAMAAPIDQATGPVSGGRLTDLIHPENR